MIDVIPVTYRFAAAWVKEHHRHLKPPRGQRFALAAVLEGRVVGVAIAGRPNRPKGGEDGDGRTLEITRVATDGTPNACSRLYGACRRAGRAMGYLRFLTYTLPEEPGTSLRASGWRDTGLTVEKRGWSRGKRPRADEQPTGPKRRWIYP